MKLLGQIDVRVAGERVLRNPNVLDRIRTAFGGEPDLRTSEMRASLEATAVIDAMRAALGRLGITNAVSLVIDDAVLYQDRDRRTDDLGDLYVAFHENKAVFDQFSTLRLAMEHEEAGLHLVLEMQAKRVHRDDEAAVRIVVSARVAEFEPRPDEDAESYRRRVAPLTGNSALYEIHERQFESFTSRLADAIRAALPEASVEVRSAAARVQKPREGLAVRPAEQPSPSSSRYDPFEWYYPNPFGVLLSAMVWSSIFSMAVPPHFVVVDERGYELGTSDGGFDGADDGDYGDGGEYGDDQGDDGGYDDGDFGGDDFGGDL